MTYRTRQRTRRDFRYPPFALAARPIQPPIVGSGAGWRRNLAPARAVSVGRRQCRFDVWWRSHPQRGKQASNSFSTLGRTAPHPRPALSLRGPFTRARYPGLASTPVALGSGAGPEPVRVLRRRRRSQYSTSQRRQNRRRCLTTARRSGPAWAPWPEPESPRTRPSRNQSSRLHPRPACRQRLCLDVAAFAVVLLAADGAL